MALPAGKGDWALQRGASTTGQPDKVFEGCAADIGLPQSSLPPKHDYGAARGGLWYKPAADWSRSTWVGSVPWYPPERDAQSRPAHVQHSWLTTDCMAVAADGKPCDSWHALAAAWFGTAAGEQCTNVC